MQNKDWQKMEKEQEEQERIQKEEEGKVLAKKLAEMAEQEAAANEENSVKDAGEQ